MRLPDKLARRCVASLNFVTPGRGLVFVNTINANGARLTATVSLGTYRSNREIQFFATTDLTGALLRGGGGNALGAFLTSLGGMRLVIVSRINFIPLRGSTTRLLFRMVSSYCRHGDLVVASGLRFSR